MPDLSTMAQEDIEYVSAHRERSRLFDLLADLRLDDERRKDVRKQYVDAAKRFDTLRAKLVK